MGYFSRRCDVTGVLGAALLGAALAAAPVSASAQSSDPIKIGFSLALTGPLAPNGKQALLGAKIWQEEINAKGGLLGRKVEFVNYDDQSNPANIPGIYTKLLEVDKVDLLNGPYGTNLVAPAIPVAMQKGKLLIGLFALDGNKEFHYSRYFSVIGAGPKPSQAFTEGYFEVAAQQKPKPQTVALAAEDAEFARNACEGARENAKTFGFNVIYDKTFPPGITDFSPVIRALQSANADLVVICSYPLSSVGIVAAANELNFTPKMLGGAMVGLQATVFKAKLKAALNGIVNYETWVPSPKLMAPAAAFFKIYQERAKSEGIDPLGYYLGGWGYAYFQLLGEAVEGAKTLDDAKLAEYMHSHSFTTIMTENFKFNADGEWTKGTTLQVQYHGITDAANLETWRGMSYQTVLTPADQKTGDLIYPYEKAK
ncbi:MAG: amino acid ABC transporter substrate-binding protein [Xanthobacteraceae bacterium]|nr:amino acid ABC transporter substrate-binding protein [Xanthobacteraceae bacterium]